MAAQNIPVLGMSTKFDPKVVNELFSKVKGESALAVLSAAKPIAFTGNKEFVFSMDNEVDIVAENGKKSHGGVSVEPIKILPIKMEYGARVSDEFMYAAEEEQIDLLSAYIDGFKKKLARGLDLAAMHGVNPRTGAASTVIGGNNFDNLVSQTVNYAAANADDNLDAAISVVRGSDGDVTGMALAPAFGAAMANIKGVNGSLYPEFRFGQRPTSFSGIGVGVNRTVSDIGDDLAIVGDFANCFRWGYAKEIPVEIIPYGDPDNSGVDLKGSNQIYLRAEAYIGWGILNAASFVRIVNATSSEDDNENGDDE